MTNAKMKKETKMPEEKMMLTIKIEAQMDGRSSLHFKDYREGELKLTRVQAVQLVERLENTVTDFVNAL